MKASGSNISKTGLSSDAAEYKMLTQSVRILDDSIRTNISLINGFVNHKVKLIGV